MFEKTIYDKKVIHKLIHKDCNVLFIKYNTKNRRAFYKTNKDVKFKSICIDRILDIIV